MRKIVSLVFVGMIAAVTLWAKPVAFTLPSSDQEYTLVTDTEYKVLPVDGISDNEIVLTLIDNFPAEIGDKHYEFAYCEFNNITSEVDKKYPHYWMISEDRSYIVVYRSLSDGRVVSLLFRTEVVK